MQETLSLADKNGVPTAKKITSNANISSEGGDSDNPNKSNINSAGLSDKKALQTKYSSVNLLRDTR